MEPVEFDFGKFLYWAWTWAREHEAYVVPHVIEHHSQVGLVRVPQGFLFDGISLAPNGPKNELMPGAAEHDWLYKTRLLAHDYAGHRVTRLEADRVLRERLRMDGFPRLAVLYFIGVRIGGWYPWWKYRRAEKRGEETAHILSPRMYVFNGWEMRHAIRITA
jgi:hypothetical protein